jgi:hypothetical protein
LVPTTAAASAFAVSTDGVSFSSASTPTPSAAWRGAAYTAKFGWVAYSTDGADVAQSTTGQSWATATTAVKPPGATTINAIKNLGNVYFALWNDGSEFYLSYSIDGCATWVTVLRGRSATWSGLQVSQGRVIVLGSTEIIVSSRGAV